MQVYLDTLGCRLNEAELEKWATQFHSRGYSITTTPENANLVILNTCAVTQTAVKKSRQLIRRAQLHQTAAKLVISGCYVSLDAVDTSGIDLIIPNQGKDNLVDTVIKKFDHATQATTIHPKASTLLVRGRHRAFIKIQDGCRHRCTFCVVTLARGKERSQASAAIIDNINQLHQQDISEVVLTGVHAGGYGSDIDTDLATLVKNILTDTDIPRLRLASLEPWDLPPSFFELFQDQRLMPHLHLPLQSGSDTVLRRMGRRCKISDFKRLVEQIQDTIPNYNITTDIIVGFPGETEEEWQDSLHHIQQIGFSHCHIFTYSKRPGTRAATLPDQVAARIKRQRSQQLHHQSKKMRAHYLKQQIGKSTTVLWEKKNRQDLWTGYTENYIRAVLQADTKEKMENTISPVKITGLTEDQMQLSVAIST